jgi:hypothetical protein
MFEEFAVAEGTLTARQRAVVDNGGLCATARLDVPIERVVAAVQLAAGKPAIKRRFAVVEYRIPAPVPMQRLGGFGPECLRLL